MLLLVLNLAGAFAFGLSGVMAGVHARLDLFCVSGATKHSTTASPPHPPSSSARSRASAAASSATSSSARSPSCAIVVGAAAAGAHGPAAPIIGAAVCFVIRLAGLTLGLNIPRAPARPRRPERPGPPGCRPAR